MTKFPRIYCISGDNSLVPGFCHQFKKYWPEAELLILHYGNCPETGNYGKFCLGDKHPDENQWSDALVPFFTRLREQYFGIMLEDYWLTRAVDHPLCEWCFNAVNFARIAKLDLYIGVKSLSHQFMMPVATPHFHVQWLELCQDERYRTSLHFNLWRKDYFLKLLRPGQSPWSFELDNPDCINDNEIILGTDNCPVDYCNLMRRNAVSKRERAKLKPEDIAEMREKGIYVP